MCGAGSVGVKIAFSVLFLLEQLHALTNFNFAEPPLKSLYGDGAPFIPYTYLLLAFLLLCLSQIEGLDCSFGPQSALKSMYLDTSQL